MTLSERFWVRQGSFQRTASFSEVVLIALVLFCLPLFEAPKNIFSVLFLIVWVFHAVRTKSLGSNCVFNLPIMALAAILWFAPLFSAYGATITSFDSAPRWTLLALFSIVAARLNYSRGQMLVIWAALLIGGIVAVAESFWVWSGNGKAVPELRSVGHVNHSSMYTLVPLAAGLGALYVKERWLQVLGVLGVSSTLAFLPPSGSLVAGISIMIIMMFGFSVYAVRRWSRRGFPMAFLGAFVIVAFVLMLPLASDFRTELASRVTSDNILSGRDKILYSALAVWDQHPILGTGWFSFGLATSEEVVREALAADGIEYDPNVYWHYNHGHNLWTTMLIERGLLGVLLVSLLLFLYFKIFLSIVFDRETNGQADLGIALGGLLVALGFAVSGLGNTTMMNEHGHAGMAFISVAYGYLRGRGLLASGEG